MNHSLGEQLQTVQSKHVYLRIRQKQSPRRDVLRSREGSCRKWTVMGIVGIGVFMATLDASIVNISLPKISLSFHAPLNGLVEG